jgi:hypothetical protein
MALAVAGVPAGAAADEEPRHHLFNPKPADKLRPLSANRPDTTESPYTVDAGHLQIETSFVDWTVDKPKGTSQRTTRRSFGSTLFILGVLDDLDVELGLTPNARERTEDRSDGSVADDAGFGDTLLRVKLNLWGNDGGDSAFAVMPYVKFPTAADPLGNNHVEGGLILPLGVGLPGEFGLGLMAEVDIVRNDANTRHVGDLLHTVTLGHDIVGALAGFVEYAGQQRLSGTARYRATFNAGLTYGVTDNLQLDAGLGVGLNDAADDLRLFTGFAARF